MSTTSPQAEAAGEQAQWQAALAQLLGNVTIPELQGLIGGAGSPRTWVPGTAARTDREGGYTPGTPGHWQEAVDPSGLVGMLSSADSSGRLGPDAAIRTSALDQLNRGYGQAQMGSREAISYGALRSGEGRRSPGAVGSSIASAATSLDRDRASALRNLEFMSAQTSMADYNKVLQLLGQGANTSLSLAGGFSGASGAALAGLSQQTQAGSVLGGASAGASLGSAINVPWGTLIGGAVGAAGGYLGSA